MKRGVRACGVNHMCGLDGVGTFGGVHQQGGTCVVLRELLDLGAPSHVNGCTIGVERLDSFDQIQLNVELLNIDERRLFADRKDVTVAQVERKNLIVTRKGASDMPSHTFGCHLLVNAQSFENFQ